MRVLPTLCIFVLASCSSSSEDAGTAIDASTQTDADAGTDVGAADVGEADLGTSDGGSSSCDLDSVGSPWPSFVPFWPGTGRNASGRTTYLVFDEGATITGLTIEEITATSAVAAWTTSGDTDSAVGWGTNAQRCPLGYQRTGARRQHRMAIGPLDPETEYFVTVRSRDATSQEQSTTSFTTAPETNATLLSACETIDTPGSYRLTADVTADCTCFEVTGSNVTLDLGWHHVTYAQNNGSDQCHGLQVRGDNVQVMHGSIEQGNAGGADYSHAVAVRSADGVEISQLFLRVHRSDAFGLRTMYAENISVHDLIVVSEVRDVIDRHYPGNRGIALDLPETGVGEIYDCVLFGVPHWGLFITGGDRLSARPSSGQTRRIVNNHVFADMHATNGYGIGVHANHVEVAHNEIRPLWNGRAMHYTRSNGHIHHNIVEALELVAGDPASGYAYYSDLADSASPHDASVCSWVVAHGIRVEGGNYGEIDHNEVIAWSPPTVGFGATALNINTGNGARGGNEVHHNQFTALRQEPSLSCGSGLTNRAGWVRGDPPAEPALLHDNRFNATDETLVIEDPSLATSTNDELIQL